MTLTRPEVQHVPGTFLKSSGRPNTAPVPDWPQRRDHPILRHGRRDREEACTESGKQCSLPIEQNHCSGAHDHESTTRTLREIRLRPTRSGFGWGHRTVLEVPALAPCATIRVPRCQGGSAAIVTGRPPQVGPTTARLSWWMMSAEHMAVGASFTYGSCLENQNGS